MDKLFINQRTVKGDFSFSGIGMHSGKEITVSVHPAPIDHGIVFVRTDVVLHSRINVTPSNIAEFYLGSCLVNSAGHRIITMEHFMAVLSVLGITNLEVEISGEEMPILDGSALGYLENFERVGVQDQDKNQSVIRLEAETWVAGKDCYLLYRPDDKLSVSYYVDYNDPMVGVQQFEYEHNYANFISQIIKARTFCFFKDVQAMHDRGLALGGSIDNALVVYDDLYSSQLRYPNEPVRHKVLDLIGDLYLLGRPLVGTIVAIKSSHALNGRLAKSIQQNFIKQIEGVTCP